MKSGQVLGFYYLSYSFMAGVVIIGMEYNLMEFSVLCASTLEKANYSLIFRSVGSIIGSVSSAPIFSRFDPHYTVMACLGVNALLLALTCLARQIFYMYFFFLVFGCNVSIIHAGVVAIIRMIYQDEAGPWLQSTCFCFQAGVIFVPALLHILSLQSTYMTLALIGAAICFTGVVLPHPGRLAEEKKESGSSKYQYVDFAIAACCFFNAGVIVETFALLPPYMVSVLPSLEPETAVMGLSIAIMTGQLISVKIQQAPTVQDLYMFVTCFSLVATCCMFSVLVRPYNEFLFWFSMILFGFTWGPINGMVYDIWNKRTTPTFYGAGIVMLGSQSGSGFYSNVTYFWWHLLSWPQVLMIGNIIGLLATMFCSYFTMEWAGKYFAVSSNQKGKILMEIPSQQETDSEKAPLL